VGWYVYFILFTGQIIERSTNKGRNLRVFEKFFCERPDNSRKI